MPSVGSIVLQRLYAAPNRTASRRASSAAAPREEGIQQSNAAAWRSAYRAQILPIWGLEGTLASATTSVPDNGTFRNRSSSNDLDRVVGMICLSGRLLQACNGVQFASGRGSVTFGRTGRFTITILIEKS
jgi:hypothetical protein